METHDKDEALKAIKEQRLPAGERVRRSEEFNPGVDPKHDRYGTPDEPEGSYYPNRYPVEEGSREEPIPPMPPGATDADEKEGITVEDLDRNVRPDGEPPRE